MKHRTIPSSTCFVFSCVLLASSLMCRVSFAQGHGGTQQTPSTSEPLVEVGDVAVDEGSQYGNVRGFTVTYRYRVHGASSTDGRGFRMVADLTGSDGRKVHTTLRDSLRRDSSGRLKVTSFLAPDLQGRWQLSSFFVPYYILKLRPGPQHVTLGLKAERAPTADDPLAPPVPVKLTGTSSISFELQKPPYRMVQLLVRELEVAAVNTDVSFLRPHKALPDLQWRVTYNEEVTEYLHVSSHHDDRFSTTWSRYSRPFPVSAGDRLTVAVVDHDVVSHDNLGTFHFSLEQLESFGNLQPLLCGGAVHKMVLAPVIVH